MLKCQEVRSSGVAVIIFTVYLCIWEAENAQPQCPLARYLQLGAANVDGRIHLQSPPLFPRGPR